jgi:putative DNA primase/helicase
MLRHEPTDPSVLAAEAPPDAIGEAASPVEGDVAANRNMTLTSLGGSMRRRGMSEEAILAALLVENAARCKPPLEPDEVRGIAASIAKYPPATKADTPSKTEPELCSDLGNARRIVAMHGRDLRYTAAHKWLAWDGKRWRPDDTGAAVRFAKTAVRRIWREAERLEGDDAARLRAWALKSQKASAIHAALDLASTEPEIAARAEDFDRGPWLLNVKNGTLDLRTGAPRRSRGESRTCARRP